jgi:HPt (histidine-containing phosphotransfer) domain-containing protein
MPTPPTYEPEPLTQLLELDVEQPGLMNELIRIFVGDAPKQLQFIEVGLRERNPERVRQAAHFLRSGSLALGLKQVAAAAHAVERMDISSITPEEAQAAGEHLREHVHHVLLYLLGQLKRNQDPA